MTTPILAGLCLLLLFGPLFLPVSTKTHLATAPPAAYVLLSLAKRRDRHP